MFVHERLDLSHKAPTQAKYLEEASNRHIDEVLPRLVSFLRKAVKL